MATCSKCHSFFLNTSICPLDKTRLLEDEEARKQGIKPKITERYTIESLLGEGGMGSVFLGQHESLQRKVAIKVLRQEIQEEHSSTRFRREAKAASLINYRHVVSILDFGELPDGSAYYVMEHLDGKSLADTIDNESQFSLARTLSISVQIAKGLKAAHEKGVIHRDLKPDNVFLLPNQDYPDFVKILDFGVAKVVADNQRITKTGMVLGTPDYMAPEQAIGKPTDHRVDIYALGVLLYEMLAGELPFQGDSFMEILSQHIYQPPPSLQKTRPDLQISEGLEGIIQKSLKKRPENRYGSMEELLHVIFSLPESVQVLPAQLLPGSNLSRAVPSLSDSSSEASDQPRSIPSLPVPSSISHLSSSVNSIPSQQRVRALSRPQRERPRQAGPLEKTFSAGLEFQRTMPEDHPFSNHASPEKTYENYSGSLPVQSSERISNKVSNYSNLEETHILEDVDEQTIILENDLPPIRLASNDQTKLISQPTGGIKSFAAPPLPLDDDSTRTNVFIPAPSNNDEDDFSTADGNNTLDEDTGVQAKLAMEADRNASSFQISSSKHHEVQNRFSAKNSAESAIKSPGEVLLKTEPEESANVIIKPPKLDISQIESVTVSTSLENSRSSTFWLVLGVALLSFLIVGTILFVFKGFS